MDKIIGFLPEHAEAFRALNLAWIRQHWEPEAADYEALDHPQQYIVDVGGYIAVACHGQEVVGTCALMKHSQETYELAKMAVATSSRGLGIGELLGLAIIAQARAYGAKELFLDSNTVLTPALGLYRKLGFVERSAKPSPYERSNIQMVLHLEGPV